MPLDGSPLAEQALRYVGTQEWTRGATILLVQSAQAALAPLAHLTPPIPMVPAVPGPVGSLPEPEPDPAATEPETGWRSAGTPHYLLEAAHRYAPSRVTRGCTTIGDPGAAIVHVAMDQEVDAIAMATHGRSGMERVRSGSVAAVIVVSTLIAGGLGMLAKDLVQRAWPTAGFVHVAAYLHDYSFPSGHVIFATVLFGLTFWVVWIAWQASWLHNAALVWSCWPWRSR